MFDMNDFFNPEIFDLVQNADNCFNKGFFKESIELYSMVIIKTENTITLYHCYLNIGIAKKNLGLFDEAILFTEKCLEYEFSDNNLKKAKALSNLGYILLSFYKYTDALEKINLALSLNTNMGEAYNNRGLVYFNLKEYDKAFCDYEIALKLTPLNPHVYNNLGNLYNELDEYNKAIEFFNKAIKILPDYKSAFRNRGHSYRSKGNYEEAINDFNTALRLNPDSSNVYFDLGYTYALMNEYLKAIEYYNESINRDPLNYFAFNNRGNSYFEVNEAGKSIDDFEKSIKLSDSKGIKFAFPYSNLGRVNAKLNYNDEALKYFNLAIFIDPDEILFYSNKALFLFEKKMHDKAFQEFGFALNKQPDNSLIYFQRGRCYDEINKIDLAIEDYKKAIELDVFNAGEIYFRLALIFYSKKDYIKAYDYFLNSYTAGVRTITTATINRINELFNLNDNTKNIITRFCGLYNDIFRISEFVLPNNLYQYMNDDVLRLFLNDPKLRLSPAKYMNDPLEGVTLVDYLFKYFEEDTDKVIADCLISLKSRILESDILVFIRSFSTLPDSLPLWTMYTENANGCNIEIPGKYFSLQGATMFADSIMVKPININNDESLNSIKKLKSKSFKDYSLYQVKYLDFKTTENATMINLKILIKELYIELSNLDGKKISDIFYFLLLPLFHVFKRSDYEMEYEYRLIHICNINDPEIKEDSKNLNLYIETPVLDEYKIKLGPKFSKISEFKLRDFQKRDFSVGKKIQDISNSEIHYI